MNNIIEIIENNRADCIHFIQHNTPAIMSIELNTKIFDQYVTKSYEDIVFSQNIPSDFIGSQAALFIVSQKTDILGWYSLGEILEIIPGNTPLDNKIYKIENITEYYEIR